MILSPSVIPTARLLLSSIEDSDTEDMLALLTDPAIKKTYMIPDFADSDQALRMVGRFRELSHDSERWVYGIRLDGRLIGFLNDVDKTDTAIEMGYVIAPAHWGKGYATEAFSAVMESLFAAGFEAVRTGAFAENSASLRVMEKCGMRRIKETEIISYRGEDHLCVYYERKNTAKA